MTRSRLIALHALALVMTIATMTVVAFAGSPELDARTRWVVIGIGTIASIASLTFARRALRELDQLDSALRRAHQAVRPEIADHEATLADLAEIRRLASVPTVLGIDECAAQIERRLARVQVIGSKPIPILTPISEEQPRLLR